MNSIEKLIEKIPDVWFDWFARFIPGAIGILIYIFIHDNILIEIDGWLVFFFILFSYLIGHVLQPISGILVKGTELLIDCVFFNRKREKKYTKAKADKDINSNLLGKVTKAHAEANSMLSIFFVSFVNICILSETEYSIFIKYLPFYFVFATVERVFARSRKMDNLYPEV